MKGKNADEIKQGDFPFKGVDKEGFWHFEFLLKYFRGDHEEPSYMEQLLVEPSFQISFEDAAAEQKRIDLILWQKIRTMKTAEEIIKEIYDYRTLKGAWDDFKALYPVKYLAILSAMEEYRQQSYASQPMSEPTVQQLREVAKNNPDTFLAGALYVIDNYKLNSPLMSAGQVGRKIFYVNEVRDLIRLYDKEEISLSKFVEILNEKSTGLSAIELFKLKNQKKENSTAPTVKAEGWVSVEEVFTYEDMMDIAGWMAAADNKRPISELKYEAEMYIKTKLAARQPTPTIPTRQ